MEYKSRLTCRTIFAPLDHWQSVAPKRDGGGNKALVRKDMILDLNPFAEIEAFPDGETEANQDVLLDSSDIVVDCLDASVSYSLGERLHREARKRTAFSVAGPTTGFGCFAVCSSSGGAGMGYWTDLLKK